MIYAWRILILLGIRNTNRHVVMYVVGSACFVQFACVSENNYKSLSTSCRTYEVMA
jgi:hypothetical protein